ncbi:MAG: ATP-binding protein [Muribaculaceae bacterium]|nr:ATP-binding protein [Muribaculaceae bacterium]
MKRKIYNKILDWKNTWNGRTALLVDGARRIGKSWIVEEFARNEYKSFIIIDFNNTRESIKELFDNYLADLDTFFMHLSLITGVVLYPRESLIVFDEIQMYPKARSAIKYLVKDGRFDYLETGSLVSINHNVKDIVIPSEEIRINMYPMDFEEFMWATGQEMLYDYVKSKYNDLTPMGQALHRRMMEQLRTYMLVGGMPQAVLSYVDHKNMREVDAIKRSIIALYRNDISKYAGKSAPVVTRVFNSIPGLLQQHEKKFRPSMIRKGSKMRDYSDTMFWLDESRVVNFCYSTTEPSVGLALNKIDSKVKLYMADTGLLISMAFDSGELEQDMVYEKILHGKLEFNKGMIIENLVAQMLCAAGHPLYFYSSYSRENADERMEIDFLIRKSVVTSRHNIYPIEVKSSQRYSLFSLQKFSKKFSSYVGKSYVLHTKDLEIKDNIIYLPLYMTGLLN